MIEQCLVTKHLSIERERERERIVSGCLKEQTRSSALEQGDKTTMRWLSLSCIIGTNTLKIYTFEASASKQVVCKGSHILKRCRGLQRGSQRPFK